MTVRREYFSLYHDLFLSVWDPFIGPFVSILIDYIVISSFDCNGSAPLSVNVSELAQSITQNLDQARESIPPPPSSLFFFVFLFVLLRSPSIKAKLPRFKFPFIVFYWRLSLFRPSTSGSTTSAIPLATPTCSTSFDETFLVASGNCHGLKERGRTK